MKLAKLIEKLQAIHTKHGDIECVLDGNSLKASQVKLQKDFLLSISKGVQKRVVAFFGKPCIE